MSAGRFSRFIPGLQSFLSVNPCNARLRRSFAACGAASSRRTFESARQRFSINDHKFRAVICRWKIKHPNSRSFFGKSNMMLGQQTANGGAVGTRIFVLHVRIVQETLHVVDEWEVANVNCPFELVVVFSFCCLAESVRTVPSRNVVLAQFQRPAQIRAAPPQRSRREKRPGRLHTDSSRKK